MKSSWRTFLIGLLTTLLLGTASYPIYASHKVSSRRHHVEIALQQLAKRMGQYYSLEGDYNKATPKILSLAEIDNNPGYQLHIRRHGEKHFTITATPVGVQQRKDSQCGTLSITDSGTKYITGNGMAKDCWFL